jgi:hypothetical protein
MSLTPEQLRERVEADRRKLEATLERNRRLLSDAQRLLSDSRAARAARTSPEELADATFDR